MYNETYDDYIRSVLGYPPISSLNNDYQDYRNQNINYNMNSNMMDTNSMNMNTDMDLESCYPEIYKIVYPMITKKCDNIRTSVTNDDIQNMTDEIYYALEDRNEVRTTETSNTNISKTPVRKSEVKISETSNEKRETRQINRNLRDLIQILLIRELLRRRRRPHMPPRPPMPGPGRPPMRPPMRPPFGTVGPQFNRQFETFNYDIFEY